MKAKVTKPFLGVPDGETATRQIVEGAILSGNLAEVAVREGWAVQVEAEPAAEPAPKAEAAHLSKAGKKA